MLTGSQVSGLGAQWESMKGQLASVPGVEAVTASNVVPGTRTQRSNASAESRRRPDGRLRRAVDARRLRLPRDLRHRRDRRPLVLGSERRPRDRAAAGATGATAGVVCHEPARRRARSVRRPSEAVGRESSRFRAAAVSIIGVVEDVLSRVRARPFEAGAISHSASRAGAAAAARSLDPRDRTRTSSARWPVSTRSGTTSDPDVPVLRRFLDEDFEALYRGERRQGQLLTMFSVLAVAIACLGLYGLASFSTTRRTKEIGIRKTLGASVGDIVRALHHGVRRARPARESDRLAGRVLRDAALARRASLIASSSARSCSSRADSLALVVAMLTVALVATRAARAKPVTALRYE